jgi:hypothetical protein
VPLAVIVLPEVALPSEANSILVIPVSADKENI